MKRRCFNCGALLPYNSLKCKECGYMPDVELMRKCPNIQASICSLTGKFCNCKGSYQTCTLKNEADSEF